MNEDTAIIHTSLKQYKTKLSHYPYICKHALGKFSHDNEFRAPAKSLCFWIDSTINSPQNITNQQRLNQYDFLTFGIEHS